MIDIHSHILPGLDDGAANLDAALKMAKMAVKDGITAMIATPHCCDGVYDCQKTKILAACDKLNFELYKADIRLQIYPGAEIRLTPELIELLEKDELLTLGNRGKTILLELPDRFIPKSVVRVVKQVQATGLKVIIAHPERNHTIHMQPEIMAELLYEGATMQFTAGSLVGKFGRPIKLFSEALVKEGKIQYLATDCHNTGLRAPKYFNKAMKRFGSLSGVKNAYDNLLNKFLILNDNNMAIQAVSK